MEFRDLRKDEVHLLTATPPPILLSLVSEAEKEIQLLQGALFERRGKLRKVQQQVPKSILWSAGVGFSKDVLENYTVEAKGILDNVEAIKLEALKAVHEQVCKACELEVRAIEANLQAVKTALTKDLQEACVELLNADGCHVLITPEMFGEVVKNFKDSKEIVTMKDVFAKHFVDATSKSSDVDVLANYMKMLELGSKSFRKKKKDLVKDDAKEEAMSISTAPTETIRELVREEVRVQRKTEEVRVQRKTGPKPQKKVSKVSAGEKETNSGDRQSPKKHQKKSLPVTQKSRRTRLRSQDTGKEEQLQKPKKRKGKSKKPKQKQKQTQA